MTLFYSIILAIVQGITEFLPVSSSGHLILLPHFLGAQDQGLIMDVAAHGGSLLAVMLYFRREVIQIIHGFFDSLRRKKSPQAFLFLSVLIATLPGLVMGGVLHFYGGDLLRHAWIIALSSTVFGLALWYFDAKSPAVKNISSMTFSSAVIIGLAQILAFIPGTSRSGITMTAARGLGFDRDTAARFSMFLAMPIIGAATLVYILKIFQQGGGIDSVIGQAFFTVMIFSFLASIISIHWLLKWLKNHSFMVFAVYRVGLSLAIISLLL